ncbi:hypothetical protein DFQ28_004237 [Apophysomyces sp. BC1034]|nr:hypothetical protein DFQ30_005370 [Apophysomyces sp. BC1015]KAG0178522.1 hypothetical protein DFQ29_003335 [Apophysomyces sp. BC1021]KAG0188864.1 hypothetical protein DFQ28_004237 [Apophysomyces sp. BC1034]
MANTRNLDDASSSCFGNIFSRFSKKKPAVATRAVPLAVPPFADEKLPAYEECVTKAVQHLDIKDDGEAEAIVQNAIDAVSSELREISLDLHKNFETGMKEYHAHRILTDYLEKKGFNVTRHAYDMETAFTAEYTRGSGRRVGVCSEYDGLPGLGQGCGHNLIAISGVATVIGIKALLDAGKVTGKVVLFGTPAEELSIGKITLVKKRAFQDNVDVCMMLHPTSFDAQYGPFIAIHDVRVEFFGKPTHASASPWKGVNALDAMVQLWNNISMMRQQLKPTDRVHGIVTDGGKAANIIPDYTAAFFYVRTTRAVEIGRVMKKLEQSFEAAALATGCQVKWTWRESGVTKDVISNHLMADVYARHIEKHGVKLLTPEEQKEKSGGSTDMGNVSYVVPTIHPTFGIHTDAANHTVEFTAAAVTPQAHKDTILASHCLALTAHKVLANQSFYEAVKHEFDTTVPKDLS